MASISLSSLQVPASSWEPIGPQEPTTSYVPTTSQAPVVPQLSLTVPHISPICSDVLRLSATPFTIAFHIYTPPVFPMPSTNLFSHTTGGNSIQFSSHQVPVVTFESTSTLEPISSSSKRSKVVPPLSPLLGLMAKVATISPLALLRAIPLPLFPLKSTRN
ncbi:hypothetical protein GH714_002587 [Hevea brasiliensis]|uniref:Uncharacterized protein n=1 Tax=Hevea brasiliensis TaxID=3981 RepID=A0A6A6LHX6_HEVBR|nr:hypothetical protein GH714_002587 [Hevea brasiliensis]